MGTNYSQTLNRIILLSQAEAIRLCSPFVTPDHLMLGMLRENDNLVVKILREEGVDTQKLKNALDAALASNEVHLFSPSEDIPSNALYRRVFFDAYQETLALGANNLCEEHILLAILLKDDTISYKLLTKENVSYNAFKQKARNIREAQNKEEMDNTLAEILNNADDESEQEDNDDDEPLNFSMEQYTVNLTEKAKKGLLDPVVGREAETERIIQILCRRKKNNPILIGEPGVGKSAIVEGLAIRIAQQLVPLPLLNKEILTLDMAAVVAGTKYRGEFEERLKNIILALTSTPYYILFIDEIHTIVGAGSASGTLDAANILKPALARGQLRCIGATTLDEYREQIEADGALERRFQKILIEPTTPKESLNILQNIKNRYEEHHNVHYTDEALWACVNLTDRYLSDRMLPDKAIDALDEAGAKCALAANPTPTRLQWIDEQISNNLKEKTNALHDGKTQQAANILQRIDALREERNDAVQRWKNQDKPKPTTITADDVASVVAMMSNVPVQRVVQKEGERLLAMEEALKATVIGQQQAIEAISRAIRRNRSGLRDPKRPIGTFLFLGSTGVGKTHLAKQLAKYLFDNENNLIRIDMSEYMEKYSISRLIGSPPGYVGYGEGGQLTEKVRRHPYAVVLLDEIEKASPDVFNLLLQMLDEGHMTDGNGRKVDFKNTIIIMTSNIGSRELREFGMGIGFSTEQRDQQADKHAKHFISKALEKKFSPEFLNRIDEQIYFQLLTQENIASILDLELQSIINRTKDLHITLKISPKAKEFLIGEGYDVKFGARPLKRTIQRYVEDPLATLLLENDAIQAKTTITLQYSKAKGIYPVVQNSTQKVLENEHNPN